MALAEGELISVMPKTRLSGVGVVFDTVVIFGVPTGVGDETTGLGVEVEEAAVVGLGIAVDEGEGVGVGLGVGAAVGEGLGVGDGVGVGVGATAANDATSN